MGMSKEQARVYHRSYYYKRRQKLYDFLGGKCVVCGATEDLEFDHIDPAQKSFDIKDNLTLSEAVKQELEKCQLLCRAHHTEKTIRAQIKVSFEHGTSYGWRRARCSCVACSEARWHYYDRRNAARRRVRDKPNKTKRQAGVTGTGIPH